MTPLPEGLKLREARPSDHPVIIGVLKDWWGGRDLTAMLPRVFLEHFFNTSFVIERGHELVAFLIGFLSPGRPNEAYVHFMGVHPDCRKMGLGTHLYKTFFSLCRESGRDTVRACTSPVNKGSIEFHTRIGFRLDPGNARVDGYPVTLDYNLPGDSKVRFERRL